MSDQPIQFPYTKVIRADGVDYVDDDDHNKQEYQLEALTERIGGTWTTPTRPTPSAEVPHPVGWNSSLPGYEYWNGSAWVQIAITGGPDLGLKEPGLMKYIDPDYLVEFGLGFNVGTPGILMTSRLLTGSEQVILLVETLAPEPNLVATLGAPLVTPGGAETPFYFTPAGPIYFPAAWTGFIVAVIGVWDTVQSAWIDKMCVHIQQAPL